MWHSGRGHNTWTEDRSAVPGVQARGVEPKGKHGGALRGGDRFVPGCWWPALSICENSNDCTARRVTFTACNFQKVNKHRDRQIRACQGWGTLVLYPECVIGYLTECTLKWWIFLYVNYTCSFKYVIYFFTWLRQVLVAARGIFVAARGIFSCGTWDLVPWPGTESGPPALGGQSLSHWTTREVPVNYTSIKIKLKNSEVYQGIKMVH